MTGMDAANMSTGLNNIFAGLMKNTGATTKAQAAWAKMGMTSEEVAQGMIADSQGTILKVVDAFSQLDEVELSSTVADIFGNNKSTKMAMAAFVQNSDVLKQNFASIGDSAFYAGSMQAEFDARADTTENQMQMLNQTIDAMKISIGQELLPVISDALKDLLPMIKEFAPKFKEMFVQGAQAALQFLPTLVNVVLPKLMDALLWLMSKGVPVIEKLFNFIADHGPQILTVLKTIGVAFVAFKAVSGILSAVTAFKNMAGAIKLAGGAFKLLSGAFSASPIGLVITLIGAAVAAFIYLWNNCEGFRNFWIGLWNGIKAVFQAVADFITAYISAVVTVWTTVIQAFQLAFQTIWEGIKTIFFTVVGVFATYFQTIVSGWQTVLTGLQTFFTTLWENIKAGVMTFVSWILAVPMQIIAGFQVLGQGISSAFKAGINGLISGINIFLSGLNKLKIPDWVPGVGGKGFNIPLIPLLASGGFTTGPSIAGEAGREAVLSFDPRYRSENLGYWAEAGRMLGVAPESTLLGMAGGASGGDVYSMDGMVFAPVINAAHMTDAQIVAAIDRAQDEFLDKLDRWVRVRKAGRYGHGNRIRRIGIQH
jgi:phage-related protein